MSQKKCHSHVLYFAVKWAVMKNPQTSSIRVYYIHRKSIFGKAANEENKSELPPKFPV